MKLLILTKSDLILRDVDILKDMNVVISITITGFSTRKYELNSIHPERRILLLKKLKDLGFKVILRIDPLIPWISKNEWFTLIERCSFVDQITFSTLKIKKEIYNRFITYFPNLKYKLNKTVF